MYNAINKYKNMPKRPVVGSIYNRAPKPYKEWILSPENVPSYDVKERQKRLIESIELDDSKLIKGMRNYQVDFIKFMVARDGRCLLMDSMGTGKTLQSLAWLAYSDSFPALIVVTAPTKLQWEREYKRWLKDFPNAQPVEVLKGKKSTKLYAGSTIIINWDILSDWEPILLRYGFKCIIGDEAQAIGNPKSKRAKAFINLAKNIPQCIVMSGTPARSKPTQYWSMISCVDPSLYPSYDAYVWRYTNPKYNPFGYLPNFEGVRNAKELNAKLVKIGLRRTKEEVMTELPKKSIEVIPLEVDEALRKAYEDEEADLAEILDKNEQRMKVAALKRSAYLLKEKSLIKWTDELLESTGEKVVIFCWHRDVVDLLMEAFKDYSPSRIYGGMSLKEREEEKSRFLNDDKCRVIVGNIQALGTGVDGLQNVSCKAIFAELANTATDYMQACDRLHRGGQDNPVTIYVTVAKDTIDEDIAEALDEKRKVLDAVLDGKETEDFDLITEILEKRIKKS